MTSRPDETRRGISRQQLSQTVSSPTNLSKSPILKFAGAFATNESDGDPSGAFPHGPGGASSIYPYFAGTSEFDGHSFGAFSYGTGGPSSKQPPFNRTYSTSQFPLSTDKLNPNVLDEDPYHIQDRMAIFPEPLPKKMRTNAPWTPAEEDRLKTLRDAGSTWSDIAKTFPLRTEGSVKKHWYKVRRTLRLGS